MSTDKDLSEQIEESADVVGRIKEYIGALEHIQRVKKKAKRQRQKMRKHGIRLVQDYCN